jgi:plastocyanin
VAALVLVALAGIAGTARGAAATSAPKVVVDLQNDRFSKRTIRVQQGTKVRYRFLDAGLEGRHNVRPDPLRQGRIAGAPSSPSRAEGSAPFDFTYRTVGTFRLYCSLHPDMKHDVVVVTRKI